MLTEHMADRLAGIALGHVVREYPSKLDHVLASDADALPPRVLHPIFFGSFDWHSCVHGYWMLARLRRRFPAMPAAPRIDALFAASLTRDKVAGECAYLSRPHAAGFERPYGWAWLLMLAAELADAGSPYAAILAPLAEAFAACFVAYLPKLTYPVRAGTHANTAFAAILALRYADPALRAAIAVAAKRCYGGDAGCQAWEPGGEDFLSPALTEAHCMADLLPAAAFAAWFGAFLPALARRQPATLFRPAMVSDRRDGRIVHLDGVNQSRAWSWRRIAAALPDTDPRRMVAFQTAEEHAAAGLPHVAGDYMGEHWLASFAVLALDDQPAA
jgi:hypothetical protein